MRKKFAIVNFLLIVMISGQAVAQRDSVYSAKNVSVNYIPKWHTISTSPDSLSNSLLYDNGNYIGLGTTNPSYLFHVVQNGTGYPVLCKMENTGNPGYAGNPGATRLQIKNSQSSLIVQAYGSQTSGQHNLSMAAGIYADAGSKLALGSGSNMSVQIYSNNQYALPQFTITAAGRTGIGYVNPASKLVVKGDGTDSLTSALNITNNNNSCLLFVRDDGKVGIGTSNPTQKLEIQHTDATGGIVLNKASGTSSKSEIKFSKAGDELWAIGNDIDNNGAQTFFIWNQVANTMPFVIDGSSRIGIGVNPPSTGTYKLYVENGIATRDVKVTSSIPFPDFVFANDYDLPTIYEMESYINSNKHLPGMPSAAEVTVNEGFELGDMQQKMLRLIEEQSLYIIDLQKQLDALKADVSKLKNN